MTGVTFDAAGTLFDLAEPVGETYARLARSHGIMLDPAQVEANFRAALTAAPPLAFPTASSAQLGERERDWWRAVVGQAFGAAAAHAAFEACFAGLFAHYARPEAWRLFPEVADTLAELRARGMRMGVVSNFDRRLPGLVAGLGLAPFFAGCVVYSTGMGAAKPDPAIFRDALARLQSAPAAALHVGDAVRPDVEGARRAGLGAVLLDRAGICPPLPAGVPRIATLAELAGLISGR